MITQISAEIVKRIEQQLWNRNQLGFKTYRETLDDVPFENYDWVVMINEELLDALQYYQKEVFRLKEEVRILKKGDNNED